MICSGLVSGSASPLGGLPPATGTKTAIASPQGGLAPASGTKTASANPLATWLTGASPLGGAKRPLDQENWPGTAANKRTREEAKFSLVGTGPREDKFTVSPETGGQAGQAFMVRSAGTVLNTCTHAHICILRHPKSHIHIFILSV